MSRLYFNFYKNFITKKSVSNQYAAPHSFEKNITPLFCRPLQSMSLIQVPENPYGLLWLSYSTLRQCSHAFPLKNPLLQKYQKRIPRKTHAK